MVVKVTKISQNMKNKSFLSIEKSIIGLKKRFIIITISILIMKTLSLYKEKYKKILILVHGKLVPEI